MDPLDRPVGGVVATDLACLVADDAPVDDVHLELEVWGHRRRHLVQQSQEAVSEGRGQLGRQDDRAGVLLDVHLLPLVVAVCPAVVRPTSDISGVAA